MSGGNENNCAVVELEDLTQRLYCSGDGGSNGVGYMGLDANSDETVCGDSLRVPESKSAPMRFFR